MSDKSKATHAVSVVKCLDFSFLSLDIFQWSLLCVFLFPRWEADLTNIPGRHHISFLVFFPSYLWAVQSCWMWIMWQTTALVRFEKKNKCYPQPHKLEWCSELKSVLLSVDAVCDCIPGVRLHHQSARKALAVQPVERITLSSQQPQLMAQITSAWALTLSSGSHAAATHTWQQPRRDLLPVWVETFQKSGLFFWAELLLKCLPSQYSLSPQQLRWVFWAVFRCWEQSYLGFYVTWMQSVVWHCCEINSKTKMLWSFWHF